MIGWQLNLYAGILAICALISGAMAVYAWRRRPAPGAAPLALFLLAATEWSLAYALELGSTALEAKLFWARVQYFGILSVAIFMLRLVLEYTGWQNWLTAGRSILLSVVPVLGLLLVWSNEAHNLIWEGFSLDWSGSVPILVVEHGPYFWVIIAYSYLCLTAGTILLLRYRRRAAAPYRAHANVMIVGTLAPWLGNVLYVTGLNPLPGLDLTPFFFTISGLAATWAVFGLQLLDLVPIAHDLIFENMSDGVMVIDARGRMVSANSAALALLGQPAGQVIGQPAARVLERWPDLVERFRDVEEAATDVAIGEGKELRHFDLHISPLRDQGRNLDGRVIVVHDTTALKRSEQALRDQRQQLEAQNLALRTLSLAVAHSANSVVITDLTGNIEYVNPKFEESSGYTMVEVQGQNPRILKSGEQSHDFYRALWQTITTGVQWRGEFHNRRKDGSLYWERASIAPVFEKEGEIRHFVAVKEDVTERKKSELALNKLLALSRMLATSRDLSDSLKQVVDTALQIVSSAGDCTVQWLTADGQTLETIATSNRERTGSEVVRFRLGEGIAGHALLEQRLINVPDVLADPRFVPSNRPRIFRSLLVVPLVAKNRSLGTLSLGSSIVAGFSPTDETLAGLMADQVAAVLENADLLDQLQDNVAELQARNEELGAFSHTVAHDLKNPVTSIIGYADLLARHRDKMEPAMVNEFLENIYFQGQKMNEIISALLLLARVSTAESFDKDVLDMARIVEQMLSRLQPVIEEYGAGIHLPEAWPVALGYGPWVEAVWVNYVSNALKYGGRPPCVELGSTMEADGTPRFWVRDNGNGLSPEEQRRVFTPFERLHRTDAPGHGLGLSIVQRIIAALDGQVGVESTSAPGQGSTFYFTLPPAPNGEEGGDG